jgi:nucleotide-binding universal stress UspA family protein
MNPELANSALLLLYLALGTTAIALFVGWALKRVGRPQITAQDGSPAAQTNGGALSFIDVVPKVQSLLSSSRPGLRLKNILVLVDFSQSSLRALPYASFLASEFGCRVTLLYVFHPTIVGDERGVPLTRFLEEITSGAKQVLDELAPTVWPTTRTLVRVGEPVSQVLQEVVDSDVDLIILGKPRGNALWQRLLPSAEGKIIRRAPCPTLVAA